MALKEIGHVTARARGTKVERVLSIGPVTFSEIEHPAELEFGITQDIAANKQIGGTRPLQVLGAYNNDITWEGDLLGSGTAGAGVAGVGDTPGSTSVSNRIKVLSGMGASGAQQILKWLDERYYVIVKEFRWRYLHQFRATYSISVVVVRDFSGKYNQAQATSVDTQATALGSQSTNYSTALASVDTSTAMTQLDAAVKNAVQTLPTLTPIAQSPGNPAVGTFLSQAGSALTKARTYLNTLSGVFPNSHVLNANGLVSTLSLLINNVQRGQSPTTLQVTGGSWPSLAARLYGDASLWTALAKANNASGVNLPSGVLTTIVIPPLQKTTSS